MNIYTLIPIALCLVAMQMPSAYSQQKYEREYRIKAQGVPTKARQFVEGLQFHNSAKWYLEHGLEDRSVEAKVMHNKLRYSIEFDTLGNLQDVEIVIDRDALPKRVLARMDSSLRALYNQYRFRKIQIQYTGVEAVLARVAMGAVANGEYITKYEVVLKGKDSLGTKLYEFTFDEQGNVLGKVEIIFRNTDNLEY